MRGWWPAFLHAWDGHREVFSGLLRTTLAGADAAPPALDVLRTVVLAALVEVLDGPDARLRADLVVAQIIGMAMLRYLLQVEPLASHPGRGGGRAVRPGAAGADHPARSGPP